MDEMDELREHIEEAAEESQEEGKASIAKLIGLTMAVLGVLLAVCAALVGGARTSLVTTMVEQNRTQQSYQAVSTKYRTLMAQLQQLHALLPSDPGSFKRAEDEVALLEDRSTLESQAAAAIIHAMRIETQNILNTVTPTGSDVLRFVSLVRDYDQERELAKRWAESYEDKVKAYEGASEHYEWAQLCAEFGIVLASIALLMKSRTAWAVSIGMAIACVALIGWSYASARGRIASAEDEIAAAKHAFAALDLRAGHARADEELLKDIERVEGSPSDGPRRSPPVRASADPHAEPAGNAAPNATRPR